MFVLSFPPSPSRSYCALPISIELYLQIFKGQNYILDTMCQEFLTYWYGEMASQWAWRRLPSPSWRVMDEVAIRCGNQEIVLKKCLRARWFGKCTNIEKSVLKVRTLCPDCFATSHNDPFYLNHLQPSHRMYSPPASPTTSSRPATMQTQSPSYLAPTQPSATYQHGRPSGSYAQTQLSRPTTQRTQQIGRSLTQPGLHRSPAVRRPASRAKSSTSTRTGPSGF